MSAFPFLRRERTSDCGESQILFNSRPKLIVGTTESGAYPSITTWTICIHRITFEFGTKGGLDGELSPIDDMIIAIGISIVSILCEELLVSEFDIGIDSEGATVSWRRHDRKRPKPRIVSENHADVLLEPHVIWTQSLMENVKSY